MNESTPTTAASEFDRNYAAEQLRRSRTSWRRLIKAFYLRNYLADVRGPTIDFGCGTGQLLARLPKGSVGLEVNPALIEALLAQGLDVRRSSGTLSDFDLPGFESGRFRTLVIAHVLEHLSDPVQALTRLLAACRRIGVDRVIVVVPTLRGFASDRTHKTYIDRSFVETRIAPSIEGFSRVRLAYFPGPWEWIGRYYVFHEMKLIYDRVDQAA